MLSTKTIRADKNILDKITALAEQDGRSFSDYVRRLFDAHLEEVEPDRELSGLEQIKRLKG